MEYRARMVLGVSLGITTWSGAASRVFAQGPPDYDFQWTTIGNVGNAPYTSSNPADFRINGRGRVDYAFRASRLEITTAQWVEFLNAFASIPGVPLDNSGPQYWGGRPSGIDPTTGRTIWHVSALIPNAAQLPVSAVSWYDAARYCNWLTNSKQANLAALRTGSYDTTTWGGNPDGTLTDAPHRTPGAMFFMSTLDEWLKASHYDPNRSAPGQGGYWQYKNRSDSPGVPGPPGTGTTSAGYQPGGDDSLAWFIPLGAYADQQSAYGLWDTSGGAQEWLEDFAVPTQPRERYAAGTWAGIGPGGLDYDLARVLDGGIPWGRYYERGFRMYSSVPTPGSMSVVIAAGLVGLQRRRTPCSRSGAFSGS